MGTRQRRRLTDLYVTGKEITIDDGQGPVTVWIQKLNGVDQDLARRRAAAARARALLAFRDKQSEEYQQVYSDVADFGGREALVEYLIQEELFRVRQSREAELAAADEWSENEYLNGLRDAWDEGLKERHAVDPEDPEAKLAFDELKRFADALEKQVEGEAKRLRKDLEDTEQAELVEKVAERFVATRGDLVWVNEFRRTQVWLATRDPDEHKKRYFHDREEVDLLSDEVLSALSEGYRAISVEPTEGKGSGGTQDSSSSSARPDPEATQDSSGPLAVVQ